MAGSSLLIQSIFDRIGDSDGPEYEADFARFAPPVKEYCTVPPATVSEDLP